MGRLARAFTETRTSLTSPSQWLFDAFGSVPSASGVSVDGASALRFADVYACVRVLADAASLLPLPTYHRLADGSREKVPAYPTAVLFDRPSAYMTRSGLVSTIVNHLNSWGNAYVGKIKQNGRPSDLIIITPNRVLMRLDNGEPVFIVQPAAGSPNSGGTYSRNEICHIKLMGDGLIGWSPIRQAREAIGGAIALEEYANRFLANGGAPSMALKTDGRLSDAAAKNLKASWKASVGGRANAGEAVVLEEGLTPMPLQVPQKDAQFIEQRQFSSTQIARIFRIPPYMIAAPSPTPMTYSNVEQESLHFVTYSLAPHLVAIEQAFAADPDFYPDSSYYPEFLVDALLRSDTHTRMQSYEVAIRSRVMLPDEARALENRPPLPDGTGMVATPEPPPQTKV